MQRTIAIRQTKQVLVEGRDAEIVFDAFKDYLGLREVLQVHDFGAVQDFRGYVRGFVRRPGFRETVVSLGVIRDAESDPRSAFQSVCEALGNAGLPVPSTPETAAGDSLRVSVLILPNANSRGMLETLLLQSVATTDAMNCINQLFACLAQKDIAPPTRIIEKAHVHAFLATRNESYLLPGRAAYNGHWPWENAAFDHVKQFFRSL